MGRVGHGAGPVVRDDLAGSYAVSKRVGKCAVVLRNVKPNSRGGPGGSESGIKGLGLSG